MTDSTNIITNFKNSSEKVGQLNRKTHNQLAKILSYSRSLHFDRKMIIPGRKVKFLLLGCFSIYSLAVYKQKTQKVFKKLNAQHKANQSWAPIIPIFQLLEDLTFININKRDQAVKNISMSSERMQFLYPKGFKPYLTTDEQNVLKLSYRINNGGVPGPMVPLVKSTAALKNPIYNNLSI